MNITRANHRSSRTASPIYGHKTLARNQRYARLSATFRSFPSKNFRLDFLNAGDTLVVTRIDRLARSAERPPGYSKIGDVGVRTVLYEAANVILTRPVKGSRLKSWAMRVAGRAGMRKAKVALARKLAVVLHRMLADGTAFDATLAAAARASA